MEQVFPVTIASHVWPTHQQLQTIFQGVSHELDDRVNVGLLHPMLARIEPPRGCIEVVNVVIDPSRILSSDDVIRWSRSQSLRLLFPWEYYAFVVRYLEELREVRTVCLGFQYRKPGKLFFQRAKHFVPHAYQIGQDLCLDSAEYEHLWLNGTRFLFARE